MQVKEAKQPKYTKQVHESQVKQVKYTKHVHIKVG